mmetsp:Transcript_4247/g.9695  ORF Transcript_4247/g.9695 Transcript_4247/m.9695 type:complete len:340 (+) Transcript_4247:251-1270(+)
MRCCPTRTSEQATTATGRMASVAEAAAAAVTGSRAACTASPTQTRCSRRSSAEGIPSKASSHRHAAEVVARLADASRSPTPSSHRHAEEEVAAGLVVRQPSKASSAAAALAAVALAVALAAAALAEALAAAVAASARSAPARSGAVLAVRPRLPPRPSRTASGSRVSRRPRWPPTARRPQSLRRAARAQTAGRRRRASSSTALLERQARAGSWASVASAASRCSFGVARSRPSRSQPRAWSVHGVCGSASRRRGWPSGTGWGVGRQVGAMRKACCTGALVSCGAHAQGCFLDTLERLGGGGRACTTRRGQSRIHALCATQWGLLDEPHGEAHGTNQATL